MGLGIIGLPGWAQRAYAGGVVGDGTPGSCTEAALDIALAGGGAVSFRCGPGLKVLTVTSQKLIASDTTIDGGNLVLLSGGDKTRIFTVYFSRHLTLNNLTLTNGYSGANYGGAIFNGGGIVVLNNSTIQDSRTDGFPGGALSDGGGSVTLVDSFVQHNASSFGALYIIGSLHLIRSTVYNNVATKGGGGLDVEGSALIEGGAIYSNTARTETGGGLLVPVSGHVAISGTAIHDNLAKGENKYGGGIASSGSLTVTNVVFEHNAAYSAGALWNDHGRLTLKGGRIVNNSAYAAGGLQNDGGTVSLADVAIDGNTAYLAGGGMVNNGGTAMLSGLTFSDNDALGGGMITGAGGGLFNEGGTATMVNLTFSGNQAGYGGGLFNNSGSSTLTNVTLADNSAAVGGGNIYRKEGLVALINSIVVGQLPQLGPPWWRVDGPRQAMDNCVGSITSLGYNLSDDSSCTLIKTGDEQDTVALLHPLDDNGGPTRTHLPFIGSPAIDTGTRTGCPAVDQRGVHRPFGASCDKGAVEYNIPPSPTPRPPTPTQTATPASPTTTASPTATTSSSASPTASSSASPTMTPGPTDTGVPSATSTPTLWPAATSTSAPPLQRIYLPRLAR